jgi:hypothetical protein
MEIWLWCVGAASPVIRDPKIGPNASKGTAPFVGSTGKFASMNGKNCKWTGLANGGSYFCCGN